MKGLLPYCPQYLICPVCELLIFPQIQQQGAALVLKILAWGERPLRHFKKVYLMAAYGLHHIRQRLHRADVLRLRCIECGRRGHDARRFVIRCGLPHPLYRHW
jgi:hypothetical protein